MEIYFVSKNSGPSWSNDPIHLLLVTTNLDKAIEKVGDFKKYQKEIAEWPEHVYSALPLNSLYRVISYYMADGWWYSIVALRIDDIK